MEKLVSNEEIEKKTKELVESIKEDNKYKEYLSLKKKLTDNRDIMSKIEKIKRLQKEYIKSAYLDKEIKAKLDKLNKELNNNVLYKEYLLKEKEINNILINIKEGLNIIFENILNENDN